MHSYARFFLESDNDIESAIGAIREEPTPFSGYKKSGHSHDPAVNYDEASITPYDLVPYQSMSFEQTHPAAIATIAMLVSHTAPAVNNCRVLELGCASGGNLLPMAEMIPAGRFVGIDASSSQVSSGKEVLAKAGLRNVELRCQDILDFSSDEEFDFIISHGVYSWVPDRVKQKILDICRTHLAPSGVAYISYNVYPSWHVHAILRDIMMYSSRSIANHRDKLFRARRVVRSLSNSVMQISDDYRSLLSRGLQTISERADYYLIHDHLEEVNTPRHFHEFVAHSKESGLQYLGEADYAYMNYENLSSLELRFVMTFGRDTSDVEQYKDFLRNTGFRRSLLCHAECELDRTKPHQRLLNFYVSSSAKADSRTPDLTSTKGISFKFANGVEIVNDPTIKQILFHLGSVWPLSLSFLELASLVHSTAKCERLRETSIAMSPEVERFSRILLRLYASGLISLNIEAPRNIGAVSDRPRASRLMRIQAAEGNIVTNAKHASMELDNFQRALLVECDGEHSTDDLVRLMAGKLLIGDIEYKKNEFDVVDAEIAGRLAAEAVPSTLKVLANSAMFLS